MQHKCINALHPLQDLVQTVDYELSRRIKRYLLRVVDVDALHATALTEPARRTLIVAFHFSRPARLTCSLSALWLMTSLLAFRVMVTTVVARADPFWPSFSQALLFWR